MKWIFTVYKAAMNEKYEVTCETQYWESMIAVLSGLFDMEEWRKIVITRVEDNK